MPTHPEIQRPDLPNKPMTLKELGDFYASYQNTLLARVPVGSPERDLRTNAQKRLKEGFHAYFFGSIYGALFGCREALTVHVREEIDRDASLQWTIGDRVEHMNLQLKELVSQRLNPRAESAEVELQKELNKLPTKYHRANDLTVAVYLNYGNARVSSVVEPEKLNLAALWFFGWSKEQNQELFLIGGSRCNEYNFRLPWRRLTA